MTRIALGILLTLSATVARADFVGIFAGAGYWNSGYNGDIIDNASLDRDLGLEGSSTGYFYVAFEHPIPVLPNVKLAHASVSDSGTGTLTGPGVNTNMFSIAARLRLSCSG